MLLAVDIGNTNVVLSLLGSDNRAQKLLRLATAPEKSVDDYLPEVTCLLALENVDISRADGAAICSVVPSLTPVFSEIIRVLTGLTAYIITPASRSGLTLAIPEADTLGTDILAADVAAAEEYPLPVIVFDMGTATTVTVVDARKRYIGGAILPGVKLGIAALFSGTAQLPDVPIEAPTHSICGTAVESIQSGAVFGAAAMMDGLAQRFEAELGQPCTVVATGGLAGCIAPYCHREIIYDEGLLLRGIAHLYEMNCR